MARKKSPKPQHGQRGRPRKERPQGLAGELGERVEMLREQAGLSQAELAEAAGVALASIARLERGDGKPALAIVLDVAAALGVTGRKLFEPLKSW